MSICSALTRPFVGSVVKNAEGSAPSVVGPIVSSGPYVAPLAAQEGTQIIRTQGVYAARGGGVVTITTSEWRVANVLGGTGASFTPDAGDVGSVLSYHEAATETGGTVPGVVNRTVIVSVVAAEPVFAPDPFTVDMWALTDPATDGELTVMINILPANGGAAITDIEYQLYGSSWVTSGGVVSFTIPGLTNDTSVDVKLRAVNSVGLSADSDTKTVTPTAVPIFTPISISGLSSWVKADTHVTADGGNMVTAARDVRDAGYSDPVGAPVIDALAASAFDIATGELLYWKAPSFATTPASITKSPSIAHALRIMAGYGVTLADSITMETGDFEGSETTPSLAVGDTMSLEDLMYIAMLESANAAVRCIARVLGREILSDVGAAPQVAIEAFIADMTAALKADGVSGFLMESVSGYFDYEGEFLGGPDDSDHIVTAHAAAEWARYAHQTPGMDAIWSATSHTYTITAGPNVGSNTINHLIPMASDADILGAKGGALPGLSGRALHAVADISGGRRIAISVLQSGDRETDVRDIITYCDGITAGSGQQPADILPGNGVKYWKEGSDPAPLITTDGVGSAFDFGVPTDAVGPYLRTDIPDVQTLFFVWDREASQIGSTVWEAYMDIWGGEQQSERLSTLPGSNDWWVKPTGVTVYKNGSQTDVLLPFERCVIAITDSNPGSMGIFGSGRRDEFRNLSGKIREVLTYEQVLNLPQIQAVTNYLIGEYSIA